MSITNLTTEEQNYVNRINRRMQIIALGNKISAMITALNAVDTTTIEADLTTAQADITALQTEVDNLKKSGTPVNAVASSGTLTLSGVAIDGETITVGTDVYEFCADAAQSLTAGSDFAIDIESYTTKSQGTFTVTVQPTSTETFTIGDKVFTFVPNGTANADGEVSVGTDLATAKVNIVAAIMGTDGYNVASEFVTAATFAGNDCVLTALIGGVAGDSIATTETMANGSFDAITLGTTTPGADCTAANAVTAIVSSVTLNDTVGVGAVDGAGDTVVLTADIKGVAGNSIATTETMANGSFAQATLVNGVNGTVGTTEQIYFDSSYMYKAIATNTINDANWRRIALGSAY